MHADFQCTCKKVITVEYSIKDGPPKDIKCPDCGLQMDRLWQVAVHIPEGFHDDLTTTISRRMSAGKRPSGRDKIYY